MLTPPQSPSPRHPPIDALDPTRKIIPQLKRNFEILVKAKPQVAVQVNSQVFQIPHLLRPHPLQKPSLAGVPPKNQQNLLMLPIIKAESQPPQEC